MRNFERHDCDDEDDDVDDDVLDEDREDHGLWYCRNCGNFVDYQDGTIWKSIEEYWSYWDNIERQNLNQIN